MAPCRVPAFGILDFYADLGAEAVGRDGILARTSGLTRDIGQVPRRTRAVSSPSLMSAAGAEAVEVPAECGVSMTLSFLN